MPEQASSPNRIENAARLADDFELGQDAEFFKEPSSRVEFLRSLEFDDFLGIARHVNARVRGYEPRDRVNINEEGSYLPMLKTPNSKEKPETLHRGFDTIQRYLRESDDSPEEKVKGAGMAVEALLVWVHPFNDGNGRTSRFLGKFIEDGTSDIERLIEETTDRNERMRLYPEYLRIDDVTDLTNEDIILDDEEIEEIRKAQEELPITEGIPLSIERLLEDKSLQARVEADAEHRHEARSRSLARTQTAA